jgi:hypothetical protein
MKLKKLFFVIALSLIVWCSYAQIKTNADKVLSTCKENANAFLKKKAESDFATVKDEAGTTRMLAILYGYEKKVDQVNDKVSRLVKTKKISATQDVIELAFNEYKESIPDLTKDFYDKTLAEIKKRESK